MVQLLKVSKTPSEVSPGGTLPWYTSVSYEPYHKALFKSAFRLLLEKSPVNADLAQRAPPFQYLPQETLRQAIDFSLSSHPSSDSAVLQALEKLVKYSPNIAHPLYLEKDGAGLDPIALIGDFLTSTMTTAVVVYPVSPVLTLQENEVTKEVRRLLGYSNPVQGDGTFSADPGVSAIMTVNCAIHNKFKAVRNEGFSDPDLPQLSIIISETANPFWEKVVAVTGLGLNALKRVKADESGKMDVESLNATIDNLKNEGRVAVMIVATLGSDPHGAIDPLQEIADICRENDIWFHVDGHYGGPLIFREDPFTSQNLRGIHLCDSFNLGCSGLLGIPHTSSILVTKRKDMLLHTVGMQGGTSYIFQQTSLYDHKLDNGDHSIQTNRRGAVSSLWLMWQVKGRIGLGQQVKRSMELAEEFYEEIKKRENFQVIQPQTTRVLFYYSPPQLPQTGGRSGISRKIKKFMLASGGACLGLSEIRGESDEWFAVSVTNQNATIEHLKCVLDQIEDVAQELFGFSGEIQTGRQSEKIRMEKYAMEEYSPLHLIKKVISLLEEKGIYFQSRREEPVLKFQTPKQLLRELNLAVKDEPQLFTTHDIVTVLDKIIALSVHQAHPLYIYHVISTGADPRSIIADYFASTLSSACHSYEDSPAYTLMEEEVLSEARRLLGYPPGGDGVFLFSGSLAVMTALYVARASKFPESIQSGLQSLKNLRLVVFMSEDAHYCLQKGALSQGLGFSSVVKIRVDASGAMDVSELRKAVQTAKDSGLTPFYVHATAGTTVLGRFDPIREISEVCREHGLWLHVDGSIGGGYMFSEEQWAKLEHTWLADSFNFNIHKTLGLSHAGSVLLFREGGVLDKAFLFNKSSTVRNHSGIGWGKRPDVLKMWLTWKAKGSHGFGLHVDYTVELKEFLMSELRRPERQEAFMLHKETFDCVGVCFYYLPLALRNLPRDTEEFRKKLDGIGNLIKKRMYKCGIPLETFKDGDSPHFLKMHLMSSGTTEADVSFLLDAIDQYCCNLDYDEERLGGKKEDVESKNIFSRMLCKCICRLPMPLQTIC